MDLDIVGKLSLGSDHLNRKKHEIHQAMVAIMPYLIAYLNQRQRKRYDVYWAESESRPAIRWEAYMTPDGELWIRCHQGASEGVCIYWFQRAPKGSIQTQLLLERVETVREWANPFIQSIFQDAPLIRERLASVFAAASKA